MTPDAPPDSPLRAHTTELKVRDYECDMGHVVNNANYLHYLEHARHELLGTLGLKFGELAKRDIYLVVTRIEVDYLASLVSGDAFVVRTALRRQGRLRLQFDQHIHRACDDRLMLRAVVTGTAVNAQGRPQMPPELEAVLGAAASVRARPS
jgi:acyl-CoA thioester hydrolase